MNSDNWSYVNRTLYSQNMPHKIVANTFTLLVFLKVNCHCGRKHVWMVYTCMQVRVYMCVYVYFLLRGNFNTTTGVCRIKYYICSTTVYSEINMYRKHFVVYIFIQVNTIIYSPLNLGRQMSNTMEHREAEVLLIREVILEEITLQPSHEFSVNELMPLALVG